MPPLTNPELKVFERKHAHGVASAQVVKIFASKKERFSEATLRKYVQLGLLPTSRRVGIAGRHRGSSGLYPVGILRLINEIKHSLASGLSLESIRKGPLGLRCELQQLERSVAQALQRIEATAQQTPGATLRAAALKTLARHKKAFRDEMRRLDAYVHTLGRTQPSP